MSKTVKDNIIEELTALGIEHDAGAHWKVLAKLLKEAKGAKVEGQTEMEAEVEVKVAAPVPERLTPENMIPSAQVEAEDIQVDYLQKYQYRKQTEFGSLASNPAPGSKAEQMKNWLLAQPRVRTFVPKPEGEAKDFRLSVTRNGYRLDLPKNTYIELPLPIAEQLADSLKQTMIALEHNRISGDSSKEKALL